MLIYGFLGCIFFYLCLYFKVFHLMLALKTFKIKESWILVRSSEARLQVKKAKPINSSVFNFCHCESRMKKKINVQVLWFYIPIIKTMPDSAVTLFRIVINDLLFHFSIHNKWRESRFPLGLVFLTFLKEILKITVHHQVLGENSSYHPFRGHFNVWYIYHQKTRMVCSSAAQWSWTSIISINACFSLAC